MGDERSTPVGLSLHKYQNDSRNGLIGKLTGLKMAVFDEESAKACRILLLTMYQSHHTDLRPNVVHLIFLVKM